MKLAILAESAPDASAMYEIVSGIVGLRPELVEKELRTNGWDSVKRTLPAVIKMLHFQTEADGLVVLADSDKSSLQPNAINNRRIELVNIAERVTSGLSAVHGRPKLRVAVAIAAPAIEAWLLSPTQDYLSEAAWEDGIANNHEPYAKRELKNLLHGVERPDSETRLRNMISAAQCAGGQIGKLRQRFPNGFGRFCDDLLSWRRLES